jgi:serine/threonine protein kinase
VPIVFCSSFEPLRHGTKNAHHDLTHTWFVACSFLHSRDIKPENVLIASGEDSSTIHVKLCDFGMARSLLSQDARNHGLGGAAAALCVGDNKPVVAVVAGDESPLTPPGRSRAYSMIGSNYYVAPEVSYGIPYDTAVDVYSLGVTLYILLCGFPPVFSGAEQQHEGGGGGATGGEDEVVIFPNAYWKDISDNAKNLVRKMLHPDPSARITAKDALHDDWIWKNQQSVFAPHLVTATTAATTTTGSMGSLVGKCHAASVPRQDEQLMANHANDDDSPLLLERQQQQHQVNLDLVRHRLYKSLGTTAAAAASVAASAASRSALQGFASSTTFNKNNTCSAAGSKKRASSRASVMTMTATTTTMAMTVPAVTKRQRLERRASTALMALADLYRDVAQSSSPSAVNDVIAATMNKSQQQLQPGNNRIITTATIKDAPSPVVAPTTSFAQSQVHALSV